MAGEMLWSTQSGYLTNGQLNQKFQKAAQPLVKFRQFCKFKEAFGKSKGESVNWLKVGNVSTVGGSLTETDVMNKTKQSLTWGTLSVGEYGNSFDFSFKLEALSEFDIVNIMREALLDDFVKCVDGVVEREFNETKLRYVGTATGGGDTTTDGTATATNTSALNKYHIRQMVNQLKIRNVPGWSDLDGDYVFIGSVEGLEGLFSDLEGTIQYQTDGYNKILNGEVGRYYGVRFVEDTYATRYIYSASARTSTAKSWTKGLSLDGYMFGSPTVREAIVVPEEIRVKVPGDYGRDKGIAWYFLGGYQLEWDTAADTRIIKWDSKA
jgi:N4-gp56 family major capsid protein